MLLGSRSSIRAAANAAAAGRPQCAVAAWPPVRCAAARRSGVVAAAAGQQPDGPAGFGSLSSSGQNVREFSAYTSVDEWKKLDSKVNKYPCMRSFQAIGISDPNGSFQSDIVAAVASVVGPVHVECVSARPSSGGKYTAVRVGPVHVQTADQVVDIFAKIKEAGGDRLKWYM